MNYNREFFDLYRERRGTRSVKWDDYHGAYGIGKEHELLPMWVADMDFAPPVEVTEALKERAGSGMFGYTMTPDSVYESIIGWLHRRHGLSVKREWIVFTPGVVPGINLAYQQLTEPGDGIIVQTPVYYPFMNGIRANQRVQVTNRLLEKNRNYEINFEELESQLRQKKNTLLILCNPHNPIGKCWKKEELERIGELCVRYGVTLISDEIHADLIMPGAKHTSVGTLSDEILQQSVLFFAPSKTFNLAGLQTSYAIIPNRELRIQFVNGIRRFGLFGMNIFGQIALETAYRNCDSYVDALCAYIHGNVSYLRGALERDLPVLKMGNHEGTYLAWVDFRGTARGAEEIEKWILHRAGIAVDFGSWFGPGGEGFLRFNLACPRSTVEEAVRRMKQAAGNYTDSEQMP